MIYTCLANGIELWGTTQRGTFRKSYIMLHLLHCYTWSIFSIYKVHSGTLNSCVIRRLSLVSDIAKISIKFMLNVS